MGDDAGRRAHAIQSAYDAGVEAGNRIPHKIDAPFLAIRGAYDELMVEEVELELEGGGAIGNQQGRKPPRGHPQGHVPAVIDPGRAGQADLADDLSEQQQRLGRGLEGGVGQDRPYVSRADVGHEERPRFNLKAVLPGPTSRRSTEIAPDPLPQGKAMLWFGPRGALN